jgi:hypothetical protein
MRAAPHSAAVEIAMNQDLRMLDAAELDAVSGGSLAKAAIAGALAGAKGKTFPIQIDLSGAVNAGQQLGQIFGSGNPR